MKTSEEKQAEKLQAAQKMHSNCSSRHAADLDCYNCKKLLNEIESLKPVVRKVSDIHNLLKSAAKDHKAGNLVSDDLILEAAQMGYLTVSEAMNSDY